MPSVSSFAGVGQAPPPDPALQKNQRVSRVLSRFLQVSTRSCQQLSGLTAEDLAAYIDLLSEEQEADLRAVWPLLQQLDGILDDPADIPDLPAED